MLLTLNIFEESWTCWYGDTISKIFQRTK